MTTQALNRTFYNDQTTLARAVRGYIARGSGLDPSDVIPGNDDAPRPKDPYSSVLLVDNSRLGFPIPTRIGGGRTRTMQHRRADYSVQFYREGALDFAEWFCSYAEAEVGVTDAEDLTIRLATPLEYERLDDIVGDSYEERAIVDLGVFYMRYIDQSTGTIDQVECDIEYGEITAVGNIQ